MKFSLARMVNYNQLLKELENGLRKLDFRYNFDSNIVDLEFGPNEELSIPHTLKVVPNYYIVGRQTGVGQIIDGDQPWNSSEIYLKNTSSNTIQVKIIIMR